MLCLTIGKVIVGEVRIKPILLMKVLYPITNVVVVDVFYKHVFYDRFDIIGGHNQTADAALVHVCLEHIVFAKNWLVSGEVCV